MSLTKDSITNIRNMRKYDYPLIKRIAKASKEINVTKIAEKYCEAQAIEYSESVRKHINRIIIDLNLKSSLKNLESSNVYKEAQTKKVRKSKNYILTYAQANTPIYKEVWEGIKKYAKETKAEIIVIPGTYQNPQSPHPEYSTGWHPELVPYMFANEHKLNNYLTIISDANVLPTAQRPLSGFEGITGEESSIVGHPRQHKEVVPTLPTSRDKIMATTGSITIPNYRKARVGKKAEFNHVSGVLVGEIFDKEDFVMRHVSAKKDGTFQDLFYVVDKKGVRKNGTWEALILGDLHLGHHDKDMLNETFRLARKSGVKDIVLHDIFDGRSINHHEQKDFVRQVINERNGVTLQRELDEMVAWLEENKNKQWRFVNIPSNHNDWLDKWVRLGNGRSDVKNAVLYNEFQKVLFDEGDPNRLVTYHIDQNSKGVLSLGRNDSFKVKGFELNNHGDLGANGARGAMNTFRKLNVKIVSADKHFLYTVDGAHGVGISTTKFMGYNRGLSSWIQSHGVVNSLGKFQHLMFVGGKFTKLF